MALFFNAALLGVTISAMGMSVAQAAQCSPACPKERPYCTSYPPGTPGHCEASIIERFQENQAFEVTVEGKTFSATPKH
jgi:hypothetical protein